MPKTLLFEKKLEPFYERERKREDSGINSYGTATPADNALLNESIAIQNLRGKISSCNSFEELAEKRNRKF